MERIERRSPLAGSDRVLLVMLPGANDVAEGFLRWGFFDGLASLDVPVDSIAATVVIDDFLEQSVVARLEDEIIAPARLAGYRRIWLLGISLGGMGCLLYARSHPATVEGIILLAPYLGATGTVASILKAGGLPEWQPAPELDMSDERTLLAWLKSHWSGERGPRRYLGYGSSDRFASSSRLLLPYTDPGQVVTLPGAHDWETWSRLWSGILERRPFHCAGLRTPG